MYLEVQGVSQWQTRNQNAALVSTSRIQNLGRVGLELASKSVSVRYSEGGSLQVATAGNGKHLYRETKNDGNDLVTSEIAGYCNLNNLVEEITMNFAILVLLVGLALLIFGYYASRR